MKSVLIIDTPSNCEECPLRYWGIAGWSCICTRRLLEGPIAEREEWCPLRPLPKEEEKPIKGEDDYNDFCIGYTSGWNDCLEDIEK